MAPRQARAEATRQSIIDAAVELFSEVGYGETDMIDVIQRAGTTKGTCYYYFPTRESLAAAVIEDARERFDEALAEIASSGASALRNLITGTFCFLRLTEEDPLVKVGYQLSQAGRQISEVGAANYLSSAELVAAGISRAIAEGDVRRTTDPNEAASTLVASVAGCRLFADSTGDDCFARLVQVWHMLLRAMVPEEKLAGLQRVVRATSRKQQSETSGKNR